MSPIRAHRLSLLAAIIVLGIVGYGATLPPMHTCGTLPGDYPPVLAFEFARSVADLHALFGDAPGDCRTVLVRRMDRLNWGDTAVFIPLYGAFLVFFLLGVRPHQPRLARVCIVLALLACAADYAENACLLHLTAQLDRPTVWLASLRWATGVKWLLLAVVGVLGGWLVTQQRQLRLLFGALCALGLLVVVSALANPYAYGRHASAGVAVSWALFIFADAFAVARPRA